MFDMVSPISTVSASDLLAEILEHDQIDGDPDLFIAIQKADEYQRKYGMYVRPEFLLEFMMKQNK